MNHELIRCDRRPVDKPQHGSQRHDDPAHELDRRRDVAEMNIVRRVAAIGHGRALELCLVLSVLLLIGQLGRPSAVRWWRLPAPGQIGFDTVEIGTLAGEFAIQLPAQYHQRQLWPLVVFLHGSGHRGNDPSMLLDQGAFRENLPAIVAAPQCLPTCYWEPSAVTDLIWRIASRYHVDRQRIYLVGYSMGGYGTWATAAAHPEMFAAIVPIAGGGNPGVAKSLTSIPIWAFHGDRDETVPLSQSQQMIDAVHRAGGEPRLTILLNEGHGICRKVSERADLWEWLFAHKQSR